MDKAYWLNRWETGNTRFNEPVPHRYLVKYFDELNLSPGDSIFVPLCGKSVDMVWMMRHKHPIIGVEISPIAINDFLAENEIQALKSQEDGFCVYRHNLGMLYQGDLFTFNPACLNEIKAVYDRGCFVALPPMSIRLQYIDWLKSTLQTGTRILFISIEHNNPSIAEPPFSVSDKELRQYFNKEFSVNLLRKEEAAEIKPHWQERGIKCLWESVYLIERN